MQAGWCCTKELFFSSFQYCIQLVCNKWIDWSPYWLTGNMSLSRGGSSPCHPFLLLFIHKWPHALLGSPWAMNVSLLLNEKGRQAVVRWGGPCLRKKCAHKPEPVPLHWYMALNATIQLLLSAGGQKGCPVNSHLCYVFPFLVTSVLSWKLSLAFPL